MAPRDPVVLRALWNAWLATARLFGNTDAEVDVDAMLARARRATGLTDFGDPEFIAPMRLLVDDFLRHAAADRTGHQVFASLINGALENRLRIRDALRAYPDIAAEPIIAPLFIVGLPRTGTTLLQGLLAAVPGYRTPLGWETRLPALPPGIAPKRMLDRHRQRVTQDLWFATRLSPRLPASHAIGAELPEECNPLLFASMCSDMTSWYPSPTHQDHLYATGFRGAYDLHRPHLQILSFRQPARTWVLKAPAHMSSLAELLRTYPDARVVFTHRDPVESVPSMAGLAACFRMLTSPVRDADEIGARVLPMLRRMREAGHAVRAQWPAQAQPFIDIEYGELVRAPLATVRRILLHFGMAEAEGTGDAVLRYLRQQQKQRAPPIRYTCAQFGFSEGDARQVLSDAGTPPATG